MKWSQFATGFITGIAFISFIIFWTADQTIEPADLVQSYEKGFRDALSVDRPSERLEYVCAALWFKRGEQQ
jgi:hypothetical protein